MELSITAVGRIGFGFELQIAVFGAVFDAVVTVVLADAFDALVRSVVVDLGVVIVVVVAIVIVMAVLTMIIAMAVMRDFEFDQIFQLAAGHQRHWVLRILAM